MKNYFLKSMIIDTLILSFIVILILKISSQHNVIFNSIMLVFLTTVLFIKIFFLFKEKEYIYICIYILYFLFIFLLDIKWFNILVYLWAIFTIFIYIKDLKNRKNFENICLIIRPVVFYLFTGFLILYFVVLYEVLTV